MGFKPGQSGNPGGRAKLPEDVKEARRLNNAELSRVLNRFLYLSTDEVECAIKAPDAPLIEVIAGAMMIRIARDGGDPARLNIVLDRLIGKVADRTEISGPDGGPLRLEDIVVASASKAKPE